MDKNEDAYFPITLNTLLLMHVVLNSWITVSQLSLPLSGSNYYLIYVPTSGKYSVTKIQKDNVIVNCRN